MKLLSSLAFMGAAVSGLHAAPVTVTNPSFEIPALSAGGYTTNIATATWRGTNGTNDANAFIERINGFVSEGLNHIGVQPGYDIWQDVGVNYEAGQQYTLTVGVGNRSGFTSPTNESTYLLGYNTSGTTLVATTILDRAVKNVTAAPSVTAGTFADAPPLVVQVPAGSSAVGKPIRILLQARGLLRSHFDNVRLDKVPLSTTLPVGATAAATNLAPTTATVNGNVISQGSAAPTVTFFYGPVDGVSDVAQWASSAVVGGMQTGTFSANLTGLATNTIYYYRVRAVNASGTTWSGPAATFLTAFGGTSITIQNHSFELPTRAENGFGYDITSWSKTGGAADTGAFNENTAVVAADGVSYLGMDVNKDVWQDLGVNYAANIQYALAVAVGNRTGFMNAANRSTYALADNTGAVFDSIYRNATLVQAETFADQTRLVIQVPAGSAAVGRPIRVLLRGAGAGRTHFDNIRLESKAISTTLPVSNTLAVSNLTTTSATLNGSVALIGSGAPTVTFYYGLADGASDPAAWANNVVIAGTQTGAFSTNITGLTVGASYFYRVRSMNAAGTTWSGPVGTFTTLQIPAVVENIAATGVTGTSAVVGARVTNSNGQIPDLTIYYGPADGGNTVGSWASNVVLGSTANSGTVMLSGLSPATQYYYRVFSNSPGGISWAATSATFTTITVTPATVENFPAEDVSQTTATLRGTVTASGGEAPATTIYWGTIDGGTTPGNWQHAAPQGNNANDFSEDLTRLLPETVYYFRGAATNAAGTSWAAASEVFSTSSLTTPLVSSRSADGINGTSASLRGTLDDDGGQTTAVKIYWGLSDGGTEIANWTNVINLGALPQGNFSAFAGGFSPLTFYYYRPFAQNASGGNWASTTRSFATTATIPTQVIINEVMYQRPNNNPALKAQPNEYLPYTKEIEFIELHNPTAAAVSLDGWSITGDVTFTFPSGTNLAAGGFVCVAANLTHFQTQYGAPALGPYTGELKANGGPVELRHAGNTKVDEVEYGAGFPWPTAAKGGGSSMERIHWSLDPDLGGSWRSSGPRVFVPAGASGWKYRKGTSEPSPVTGDWRQAAFVEDGTWLTGRAPFGYDDAGDATSTADMTTAGATYTSLYLRKTFEVAGAAPATVRLRLYADDGAIVWVNGVELGRVQMGAAGTNFAFNANAAADHEAFPDLWQELVVPSTMLVTGTNTIAVQAHNANIGDGDFHIDLALQTPETGVVVASPNLVNTTFSATAPPAIRGVDHLPVSPVANQPVTITAKVSDPQGVGSVQLQYQIVAPGSYLPKWKVSSVDHVGGVNTTRLYANPAYSDPASWISIFMLDNGTGGDAEAGDSIFTAQLPGTLQQHRRLIRYRIAATDAGGASVTVPYADDEQPNFAYYVYNGVPAWSGALQPGAAAPLGTVRNFSTNTLNSLPIYQLIADGTEITTSQYSGPANAGFDGGRFSGTLVYDGVVYDHVAYNNRGENSNYNTGKNKWRFHFNRARDFVGKDEWGRPFDQARNQFSVNACASPWVAMHRGMAGLDESIGFRMFKLAGVPSSHTNYFHFRIVQTAAETGATQYDTDLRGLYMAIEDPGSDFLQERGLDVGNLFKVEGTVAPANGDQKSQGLTQPADRSDLTAFWNPTQSEAWYRANMDLPAYYTWHAVNRLTGNVDVRDGFNHYLYHRPGDGRWMVLPWDLDMMFIARTHWTTAAPVIGTLPGIVRQHSLINIPALSIELKNRCREVLDLMGGDISPSGGQIGQLIDEYSDIVMPAGTTDTWANIDAAMWNYNPRANGDPNNHSGQTNHKGNFHYAPFLDVRIGGNWTRWLRTPTFTGHAEPRDFIKYLQDYTTNAYPSHLGLWQQNTTNLTLVNPNDPNIQRGYGYSFLELDSRDTGVPNRPSISYIGSAGYPANNLQFQSTAFSPNVSGGTSFAAMEWRLGEMSAPGIPFHETTEPRLYEITPVWTSGELASFNSAVTIPSRVVRSGHTYRARVRLKDANGRWSRWSEAAQFAVGDADIAIYQQGLAITELNYHPASSELTEFIEIKNTSPSPIDMTGMVIDRGVDAVFPDGWTIPAGGFALLVKNTAAFQAKYGASHNAQIAYEYGGDSLRNQGEPVRLNYGLSSPIIEVSFLPTAPWPVGASGTGRSIVLNNPDSHPANGAAANWRLSHYSGGSPGADDETRFAAWAAQYGVSTVTTGDDDKDGISNLFEYAFGGNASNPNDGGTLLPTAQVASFTVGMATDNYLTATVRRPRVLDDVMYETKFSSDLDTWTGGAVLVSTTNNPDDSVTEIWRSPDPVTTRGRWFVHVEVTHQP